MIITSMSFSISLTIVHVHTFPHWSLNCRLQVFLRVLSKMGMESLLCDESWLSSPATPIHQHATKHHSSESYYGSFYTTKEDCEQALAIYLEKEMSYMPEASYIEHLRSKNLIFARFRAIQWLFRVSSLSTASCFNFFLHWKSIISIGPIL